MASLSIASVHNAGQFYNKCARHSRPRPAAAVLPRLRNGQRARVIASAAATQTKFIPRWSTVCVFGRGGSLCVLVGMLLYAERGRPPKTARDTRGANASRHRVFNAKSPPPPKKKCYEYLRGKQLETVTPEAAAKLLEAGDWVLVDVRRADQHAAAAPAGAVNVPLYVKLDALAGGFNPTKVRVGRGGGGRLLARAAACKGHVVVAKQAASIIVVCHSRCTHKQTISPSLPQNKTQHPCACARAAAQDGDVRVQRRGARVWGARGRLIVFGVHTWDWCFVLCRFCAVPNTPH